MKATAIVLGYAILIGGLAVTNARIGSLEARLAAPSARPRPAPAVPPEHPEPTLPAAVPAPPLPASPPTTGAAPAPEFREAVVRVVEELRREEDARWQERVKKAGVAVLSKELALTRVQEELITPIVEEHLAAIQKVWWPGTVVEDGHERALTYDEKTKLSDAARALVDERVRTYLDRAQAEAYRQWAGAWRTEAPKRAGEVGPLRWY